MATEFVVGSVNKVLAASSVIWPVEAAEEASLLCGRVVHTYRGINFYQSSFFLLFTLDEVIVHFWTKILQVGPTRWSAGTLINMGWIAVCYMERGTSVESSS